MGIQDMANELRTAKWHGTKEMVDRLSPDVVEIVRLDLIQKVGNALRYHQRAERDKADLAEIEEMASHITTAEWGAW